MGIFEYTPSLGSRLVRRGSITADQLKTAESEIKNSDKRLGERLIERGFIEESTLIEAMAEIYDLPVVGEEALLIGTEVLDLMPPSLRGETSIYPIRQAGRTLSVAVIDPSDTKLLKRLARMTGLKVRPLLAPPSAIRAANGQREALNSLRQGSEEEDLAPYVSLFAKLHDYDYVRTIAKGGFATVFLCRQLSLDRPVAVKVLGAEWTPIPEVATRFRKEGKIIASLDHPNVVQVYDQGEYGNLLYIVMEFFEGEPMDIALRGVNLMTKLACLRSVSSALEYAHARGIIHRDVKPSNVLVNRQSQIKLLDFGIAHTEMSGDSQMTRPRLVLGTPQYMAPEMHLGAIRTTRQSDIYAFGVMAYEVLTEKKCKPGDLAHPCRVDPNVPEILGNIVLQSLSAEPESRPESFSRISETIQRALDLLMLGGTAPRRKGGGAERRVDRAARQVESRYDFLSVLREDKKTKTTLAHHQNLSRRVVIKIRKKKLSAERLAAIMAVKGPHVAEIYGAGSRDRSVVVVREYFEDGTLAERMEKGMSALEIADCLVAIVSALREAKKHNLAHGNLQPANVLWGSDGNVKVTDFGLGSLPNPQFEHYRRGPTGSSITSKLYGDRCALGAMTYEMIAGVKFDPDKGLEPLFDSISDQTVVHSLLRYFLGRLWQIKRHQPAYNDYSDMLTDLERIRQRIASGASSSEVAPRTASKPKGLIGRTIARLVELTTIAREAE